MLNKEIVIVCLLIILAIWIVYPYFYENFDQTGTEFVPVDQQRYGLRGDKLNMVPIANYFIRPDRQVRLSQSDGMMWEANRSPVDQGMKDCKKVECPANGFDSRDTCWKCGNACH